MSAIQDHADDLYEELADRVDVDRDEIASRLKTLITEYKVPADEARRSVRNNYLDEADVDREDVSDSTQTVDIVEIEEPEEWVDLTAKVVELWEPRSDSIAQVGLLGDETGTIKFTKWAKSDLEALTEGEVYQLGNVVTDEYQGRYSVKLNSTTTIQAVDKRIEVGDNAIEAVGALVDIQSGSGLIKRCPEEDCTRVLQNGRCSEHGEVEGEFDMRIKGVIDDGDTVQEVLFDREATTDLTGITLTEAKDWAMDALDTSVVVDKIREQTLGQYYRVHGPVIGRYLLVNEAEHVDGAPDHADLLLKARSM